MTRCLVAFVSLESHYLFVLGFFPSPPPLISLSLDVFGSLERKQLLSLGPVRDMVAVTSHLSCKSGNLVTLNSTTYNGPGTARSLTGVTGGRWYFEVYSSKWKNVIIGWVDSKFFIDCSTVGAIYCCPPLEHTCCPLWKTPVSRLSVFFCLTFHPFSCRTIFHHPLAPAPTLGPILQEPRVDCTA